MATVTFTFTGNLLTLNEILDLNAQFYGYKESDGDKTEFLRKQIRNGLVTQANLQKKNNAFEAAVASVIELNGIT